MNRELTSNADPAGKQQRSAIRTVPVRIPRTLAVSALLILGIWLNDEYRVSSGVLLLTTLLLLVVSRIAATRVSRVETLCLAAALIAGGACLWSFRSATTRMDLQLASARISAAAGPMQFIGTVSNIPAIDIPSQGRNPGVSIRTVFLLQGALPGYSEDAQPIHGGFRVTVDGDATSLVRWGDRVRLTGRAEIPKGPSNPGEFDFARHLQRNGLTASVYVRHPAAVQILNSSPGDPRRWMNDFRQQTVRALQDHLSARNRATAEALLLGNRGHLEPDLERDFIASGTMHLLAISGLHVGILYVFLVRIQNLLLVPRTRSMILAGIVCVLYCFLTDLRPSVMRATVFILLHIAGQCLNREMRMGSLIGATTLILIAVNPAIAFDVGAWLSFLAVGALGWVTDSTPPPAEKAVPVENLTLRDRLREAAFAFRQYWGRSYRQMIAVTLLSSPLVASQFHVVSLTGMLINIVLIPFTTLTLISGYVFLLAAHCLPPLALLPGGLFETTLTLLNLAVTRAADVRFGFLTIPDLPWWFLSVYYLLLAASAIALRAEVRQFCRLLLGAFAAMVLWNSAQRPIRDEVTVTTLNVGHGNAVVAELPDGKVLVFDAGALNRAERTADVICRFLWFRGHRMIDALVISHPDADHYNAVGPLVDRMPVGQVVVSPQFTQTEAMEVQTLQETLELREIPVRMARHNDRISAGAVSIRFLHADLTDTHEPSDNATSLTAILSFQGTRYCLPGDLEGSGQEQLLDELPESRILVSPHHGSLNSNDTRLARRIRPSVVIVSSRSSENREKLQSIYSASRILWTSESGAIRCCTDRTGQTDTAYWMAVEEQAQ